MRNSKVIARTGKQQAEMVECHCSGVPHMVGLKGMAGHRSAVRRRTPPLEVSSQIEDSGVSVTSTMIIAVASAAA